VILNALALGARELASLPLPPSALPPIPSAPIAFPSKILPVEQHRKYIAAGNQADVVQQMLESISLSAIQSGKDDSIDKAPELVRERRLRIQKPAKVTELTRQATSTTVIKSRSPTETTFHEVAAEYFIAPLINRFWLFLRDEQTREERTAHHETLHQYRGAGTGLILNPTVLAHFLATLAVLVHAARNAPEWLAVVAPDALELAVTLGTRPLSRHDNDEDDGEAGLGGEAKSKEASVLTATLELALIVLDGCLELDGGRSIGLDHTALLLGTGEWAGGVFSLLEKGVRVPGGGGALEARLRGAAAGVLIKVDSLTSTWRRSMVNIT
jgi:telomere length regulation protein